MSKAAIPSLTGSVISYSDGTSAEANVDVFISSDLQGSLKTTMDSKCPSLDNECIQAVTDLFHNQNTELQVRQVEVGVAAVLTLVVGIIIPAFYLNDKATSGRVVPAYIKVPPAQISQASAGATASVTVVTVDSTTAFTIIPKPEPTVVTGQV